ncbi:hypothetical protein E2C01_088632 [Portunus trituberculatus]|uniref:Uncharacterized protein n=1 Tax=Portunus trituberculatus TaxID=210409 RepID=A0A5B7JGK1_PORTR|nr:hypothetical protein [Portunus trituberculatus]
MTADGPAMHQYHQS